MNIAIVGSNGYIAKYLYKSLIQEKHTIINIDKCGGDVKYLDLEYPDVFAYSILNTIDFIIFTAAISEPDKCATEFDLCWRINVNGTRRFIYEAINRGCNVLFFSSDAVYGNIPGHIYTEQSETKPETPYGKMKKAIEDEFKDNPCFKAIRLSYVVSANDKFITYCLNCVRHNKVADIFHPLYRNCITISDVITTVTWFVYHFNEYKPFSLNIAGPELVSRVRIADELNRVLNNKLNYIITQPNEEFFKNRPQITQIKSLYIQKYNIIENLNFSEKLQKELEGIHL